MCGVLTNSAETHKSLLLCTLRLIGFFIDRLYGVKVLTGVKEPYGTPVIALHVYHPRPPARSSRRQARHSKLLLAPVPTAGEDTRRLVDFFRGFDHRVVTHVVDEHVAAKGQRMLGQPAELLHPFVLNARS